MRKTITALAVLLFSLGLGGCVSMPLKQYAEVLPKTNSVYLEKAVFCKLRELNLKLSFEEPVENPSTKQLELLEIYGACLKEELEKEGFAVTEEPDREREIIVKTKLGEIPPILLNYGIIGVEVEVRDGNGKPLLLFQKGVNTSLLISSKSQIKRFVASQVARQLKKKFLE